MATAAHLITPGHLFPSDHADDGLSGTEPEALGRCVEDHAVALLRVLAGAGDAWEASPQKRRLLSELLGSSTAPSPTPR